MTPAKLDDLTVTKLSNELRSGKVVCPKCRRKGVGYAGHPHAFGYKDYNKASCRYCRATFKIKETP